MLLIWRRIRVVVKDEKLNGFGKYLATVFTIHIFPLYLDKSTDKLFHNVWQLAVTVRDV